MDEALKDAGLITIALWIISVLLLLWVLTFAAIAATVCEYLDKLVKQGEGHGRANSASFDRRVRESPPLSVSESG